MFHNKKNTFEQHDNESISFYRHSVNTLDISSTLKNNLDVRNSKLKKLYRNKENIKFVLDALYGATNEPRGTSYRSRLTKKGYVYAGKTGTSQIRKITAEERELNLKQKDLPWLSNNSEEKWDIVMRKVRLAIFKLYFEYLKKERTYH